MIGRLSLLAFVGATGSVHLLPVLPGNGIRAALLVLAFVLAWVMLGSRLSRGRVFRGKATWCRHHGVYWPLPVFAALCGFLLTVVRADARLSDVLDESNVNLVSRVELRVVSLPRLGADMQSFDADVIASVPDGVPSRIRVSWRTGKWGGPYARGSGTNDIEPRAVPGQVWRMALVLKPPHGARNPHGFDYESYLFAHGVRAMGSVRGSPVLLRDEPWHGLGIMAERARHHVRERMLPYLQDKRYGAVLLALVIGDQASVRAEDWQVFNRTGITHLVSISGTHVTMIAGLGGMLVTGVWRRIRWRRRCLAEYVPAQTTGALAALLVAWLYCLLAGWGVPAQRTFLMLAVVAVTYMLRLALCASRLLALAAFVVVLLDPWALLSSGFWLSFGAVAVLIAMAGAQGRAVRSTGATLWSRAGAYGLAAARLQLMISAALLPALALLFNEISIASPLANAYAIPVISVLVTPLALLAAAVSVLPGAQVLAVWLTDIAHLVLQWMMWPTAWLAGQAVSSIPVAAAPVGLTLLAVAGLAIVLFPRGLQGAWLGWLFVVPALAWVPARPVHGGWHAVALDVGQASAIVIRTARHDLLFDTGVRHNPDVDSGSRIIWPYFRSSGVRKLDALVVSHADIDHVGGLRSLLETMGVEQTYSSFNIDQWLRREASMLDVNDKATRPRAMTTCRSGQQWEVDGVMFEILWPVSADYSSMHAGSRERNDRSCVLRVQGRHHSLLLTGDISAEQELQLVRRGLGQHDVVMASHHGSNSSSGVDFIQAVDARHVVMQAGAWSRYGHPHPAAVQRWRHAGAAVWRTDLDGAIHMTSHRSGLVLAAERDRKQRYWQTW